MHIPYLSFGLAIVSLLVARSVWPELYEIELTGWEQVWVTVIFRPLHSVVSGAFLFIFIVATWRVGQSILIEWQLWKMKRSPFVLVIGLCIGLCVLFLLAFVLYPFVLGLSLLGILCFSFWRKKVLTVSTEH